MAKLDLKKELRHLYKPSAREVSVVDVPEMKYLMIDGIGDPNTAHGMPRRVSRHDDRIHQGRVPTADRDHLVGSDATAKSRAQGIVLIGTHGSYHGHRLVQSISLFRNCAAHGNRTGCQNLR